MYIVSFFTQNNAPILHLLDAKIRIINVPDGVVIIDNEIMSELGYGFYYYNFAGYDYTKDYAIVCDGSDELPDAERYVIAGNENYHEDIDNVISNNNLLKRMIGLMHENIYIDNPIYDESNNLVNARVRIYSNPASIGSDINVIGSYLISSTGSGPGKFTNWSQLKL